MNFKVVISVCLTALCIAFKCIAGDSQILFVFYATKSEKEVVDSLNAHISKNGLSPSIKVHLLKVKNGNIRNSVQAFTGCLDSLRMANPAVKHAIIGCGMSGSAAATISAASDTPEKLALISPPCIAGDEIVRRFLFASTYILNLSEIRNAIRDKITYSPDSIFETHGDQWIMEYKPAKYLQKIQCPIYAVFGTEDALVEWYSNCVALDSAIIRNPQNVIRAYFGMGHCLRENMANSTNVPMPGDFNPTNVGQIDLKALRDLANWITMPLLK